jgi:hypothetical protein
LKLKASPYCPCLWQTVFVPKANLRPVPGTPPFQEFECSVCKTKFAGITGASDISSVEAAGAFKAAMFKKWSGHLHTAHPRQWEAEQKKKAKFEAANRAKGFGK